MACLLTASISVTVTAPMPLPFLPKKSVTAALHLLCIVPTSPLLDTCASSWQRSLIVLRQCAAHVLPCALCPVVYSLAASKLHRQVVTLCSARLELQRCRLGLAHLLTQPTPLFLMLPCAGVWLPQTPASTSLQSSQGWMLHLLWRWPHFVMRSSTTSPADNRLTVSGDDCVCEYLLAGWGRAHAMVSELDCWETAQWHEVR